MSEHRAKQDRCARLQFALSTIMAAEARQSSRTVCESHSGAHTSTMVSSVSVVDVRPGLGAPHAVLSVEGPIRPATVAGSVVHERSSSQSSLALTTIIVHQSIDTKEIMQLTARSGEKCAGSCKPEQHRNRRMPCTLQARPTVDRLSKPLRKFKSCQQFDGGARYKVDNAIGFKSVCAAASAGPAAALYASESNPRD